MRSKTTLISLALFTAVGCNGGSDDPTDDPTDEIDVEVIDLDGDGVAFEDDCDDDDPDVYPDAPELCDGLDNDCDDEVDEDVELPFYADDDGDGYGAGEALYECEVPDGMVGNDDDCDDADAAIHPGASEICDGIDNDCSDRTSEAGLATVINPADGSFVQDATEFFGSPAQPLEFAGAAQLNVCDGTFYGAITVKHDLTVQGFGEAAFDGEDAVRPFTVEADGGVRLFMSDVTVQNGKAGVTPFSYTDVFSLGGAIFCKNEGNQVDLTNVVLRDNLADGGALSIVDGCDAFVLQSEITGNTGLFGSASYAFGSLIHFDDSHIHANATSMDEASAGSVYISVEGQVKLTDSVVENATGTAVFMWNYSGGRPPKLTCAGSESIEAGMLRSSVGLGLADGYGGRIDLENCDFGEGTDENGVDVLYELGTADWFGNDMNGYIEGAAGRVE